MPSTKKKSRAADSATPQRGDVPTGSRVGAKDWKAGGSASQRMQPEGDQNDPGRYTPHSSVTGRRKQSFGYVQELQGNLLSATTSGRRQGKLKQIDKPGFGGTSKRNMRMEVPGDDAGTPGPGAYLPSSTFGKYSKYQTKNTKGASPQFRSTSPQRPKVHNENVPGAGAYTPKWSTMTRDDTNGAPHLNAKGLRFGKGTDLVSTSTDPVVGPGAYNSHVAKTVAADAAKRVQMMSRQGPGFGVAGQAHLLPHEEPCEDCALDPGPGKYESPDSGLNKVGGHTSVFKMPTERKKQIPQQPVRGGGSPSSGKRDKKMPGSSKKGSGPSDGTVRV